MKQINKGELKIGDSQIIIYQAIDGQTKLDVRLEEETVWLNQKMMAELFQTTVPNINMHLKSIFEEDELDECSTIKDFLIVQQEGNRSVERTQKFYNLDAIISVGYRIKSRVSTKFRQWATQHIREYLVKGYVVNESLKLQQYSDLKQTVKLLSNVLQNKELSANEASGLLQVITDYAYALDTLDKYDYQQLTVEQTTEEETFRISYEEGMDAISYLKNKFGGSSLFGNEKDESFKSSVNTIYQTFDGQELYTSVEEKAAMLLYLVTKNHSFSDGNKRIAAFLFLWFLEKNRILYKADGTKLIENNTLVALTLMIAESRTEEKDVMVKLVVNLINKNN